MLGCFLKEDSVSCEILQKENEVVKNNDLKDLFFYGFVIYYVGMVRVDWMLVEDLFVDGYIQVLVFIVILVWGVNFFVYFVIIKGIQIYNLEKGVWIELSLLDVM